MPLPRLSLPLPLQKVAHRLLITPLTENIQSRPTNVDAIDIHYQQLLPLPLGYDDHFRALSSAEDQRLHVKIAARFYHPWVVPNQWQVADRGQFLYLDLWVLRVGGYDPETIKNTKAALVVKELYLQGYWPVS